MLISTKGRYALRVLLDLAEYGSEGYIPLKDVAERQDISLKYLEGIMSALSKADMVDGLHGKGGGYKLCRPTSQYVVGDILKLTEGTLAPVACLDAGAKKCPKADRCKTLSLWKGLDRIVEDYLYGITLEDLLK